MTTDILKERQAWTLAQKVDHALATIDVFVSRMGGIDKVYCSFSGGKDSTVLLNLCRILYPDILAVFCSTGNEYPEIIQFVRKQAQQGANIHIIRPEITPRQVWAKYGFPLVGKETAQKVHKVRFNPNTTTASIIMGAGFFRLANKWRYLITEPYETSSQCCDVLKKRPFHKFEKITGRRPIIGVMADESNLRKGQYIKAGGCNVFGEKAASRPCQYGQRRTYGNISRRNGLKSPRYIAKARREQAAWVVDSAHSSTTTAVLLFSSKITRRLTI